MAWTISDWLSYTGDPSALGAAVQPAVEGKSKGASNTYNVFGDNVDFGNGNDNGSYYSGGGYSSANYEAQLKKEAKNKAKVLESEYEKNAKSLITAAQARQRQNLLAIQNAQKDLASGKDIAGRTRRQTEDNSRWLSNNDFFKAQNALQNTRRFITNSKNTAYGSIGNTINGLIQLQNGKNNHNIADTLQTNLQGAADNYVSQINNLNSNFNKQYDQVIQNQMANEEEFRQAIQQNAADFYSQIAGLGDYVFEDYFNDDGSRKKNLPWVSYAENPASQGISNWTNGITLNDGTKLDRIENMLNPERRENIVDINEVQKALQTPSEFYTDNNDKENKSYKSFRSPETEAWTQA